nr:hypothetical protein [Candidatus Freyarchaeota archaeon]
MEKLSTRVYEVEDDFGYRFVTLDVICAYCTNCKRYTGLERKIDDNNRDWPEIFWFYLPRFPKQTELVNLKQLKSKPPKFISIDEQCSKKENELEDE